MSVGSAPAGSAAELASPRSGIPPKLVSLKSVMEITELSRPTIYRLEAAGKFPKRLKITEYCTRWRADEVQEWIEQRSVDSRGA